MTTKIKKATEEFFLFSTQLLITLIAFVYITTSGCDNRFINNSQPIVKQLKVKGGIGAGLDYGATVEFTIENIGEEGFIKVVTFLNSSEGKSLRTQEIYLRAGQSQFVSNFFHEISFGANNLKAGVRSTPPCTILYTDN